jgi:hypothetical protein
MNSETRTRKSDLSPRMREIVRRIRSINPDLNDLGHAQLKEMEDAIARLKKQNEQLKQYSD